MERSGIAFAEPGCELEFGQLERRSAHHDDDVSLSVSDPLSCLLDSAGFVNRSTEQARHPFAAAGPLERDFAGVKTDTNPANREPKGATTTVTLGDTLGKLGRSGQRQEGGISGLRRCTVPKGENTVSGVPQHSPIVAFDYAPDQAQMPLQKDRNTGHAKSPCKTGGVLEIREHHGGDRSGQTCADSLRTVFEAVWLHDARHSLAHQFRFRDAVLSGFRCPKHPAVA